MGVWGDAGEGGRGRGREPGEEEVGRERRKDQARTWGPSGSRGHSPSGSQSMFSNVATTAQTLSILVMSTGQAEQEPLFRKLQVERVFNDLIHFPQWKKGYNLICNI